MIWKSKHIFLPFCHNSRVWLTDGRTDRQTDGRTEFSSQDCVCIPCSAVKTHWQFMLWMTGRTLSSVVKCIVTNILYFLFVCLYLLVVKYW